MTHLRKMMLEELQRRNYSEHTVRAYVRIIRELSAHFRQPPDRLGPEHMRLFQAHLFRERKLNARTIVQYSAALRFFFVKTLKREEVSANTYRDLKDLAANIETFIEEYYNRCRLHSALGYRPPDEFERQAVATVPAMNDAAGATIRFFRHDGKSRFPARSGL